MAAPDGETALAYYDLPSWAWPQRQALPSYAINFLRGQGNVISWLGSAYRIGAQPLTWTPDGSAFIVRLGTSNLVAISPDGNVVDSALLADGQQQPSYAEINVSTFEALENVAQRYIRLTSADPYLVRSRDINQLLINNEHSILYNIVRRSAISLSDDRLQPVLSARTLGLGLQALSNQNGIALVDVTSTIHYAARTTTGWPVVDRSTGAIIGDFSARHLHLARPEGAVEIRLPIGDADEIIAADAANGRTFVLVRRIDGQLTVFRVGASGEPIEMRALCGASAPTMAYLPAITEIKIATGHRAIALRGLLASPAPACRRERTQRRLRILFHGGPYTNWRDSFETRSNVIWSDPCVATLAMEMGGSAGVGEDLANSLRDDAPSAIDLQVSALINWVSRQRFTSVDVVGLSMGGIYAVSPRWQQSGMLHQRQLFAPMQFPLELADSELGEQRHLLAGVQRSPDTAVAAVWTFGNADNQQALLRFLDDAFRRVDQETTIYAGNSDWKSPADRVRRVAPRSRLIVVDGDHNAATGAVASAFPIRRQ